MSILPGTTIIKDADAELVYTWDWSAWLIGSALIASTTFIITPPASEPTSDLTKDSEGIVTGSTSTSLRLLGGTTGKKYTVTNRVVTNESPAQTDDRSIVVKISAQ